MALTVNQDQKTAQEGRDSHIEGIEEGLVDKSPKALLKKLQKEEFGLTIKEMWAQANSDRTAWLTRQEAFLQQYDEFLDPIMDSPTTWGADIHLPIALTIGKTFHARFFSALMGTEPFCNVKARKGVNEDRTVLISDLMQYTLKSWAND